MYEEARSIVISVLPGRFLRPAKPPEMNDNRNASICLLIGELPD
jgi:hypothetical protein